MFLFDLFLFNFFKMKFNPSLNLLNIGFKTIENGLFCCAREHKKQKCANQ